ncbi:MAG: hypothetical protein R3C53_21200 [Pirellulaceae bacterium]
MRSKSGFNRVAIFTVCFLVGICGMLLYRAIKVPIVRAAAARMSHLEETSIDTRPSDPASAFVDSDIASPELEPREVVLLQLESMRASLDDVEQLKACFSLASPSNRELTGPFEQFAEMVYTPPYDVLLGKGQLQVGSAVVENEVAAVLVTAIDTAGRPNAFRFVLVKQSLPPYEDCWMTEAVQLESIVAPVGADAKRKAEGNVGR